MRLFFSILTIALSSFLASAQSLPQANTKTSNDKTVYVTKTGEKYHKTTCHYLKYSKIETTEKQAKADGYTACKVCFGTTTSSSSTHKQTSTSRCQATTQKGTQCNRTASSGSRYCWQHQ